MSINPEQINEMADQIRGATDCEAIKLVVDEQIDALRKRISSALNLKSDISKQYLPLVSPPGPNPLKIVKWIKKQIAGIHVAQLKSYIETAKDIIEMARAVSNLADAIQSVEPKLKQCALEIAEDTQQALIGVVQDEVNNILNQTLADIEGTKISLGDVLESAVIIAAIDTSSVEGFTNSIAGGGFDTILSETNSVIQSGQITNTVLPTTSGIPQAGEQISCSNGTWIGSDQITYTYQWIRVGEDTKVNIEGATGSTYTATANDVGNRLACIVYADSPGDAENIESTATSVIEAAPPTSPV